MDKVLNRPKFKETLTDIARQQGVSLVQVTAQAKEYLKELQTKHEPIADLIGVQLMQYIVSRGYDKTIDVNPLSSSDNTRVFEVPEGRYFMMGDNRDNSADSRSSRVGFVPLENFIGKASVIFFSIEEPTHPLAIWKWPEDLRGSRIFSGL